MKILRWIAVIILFALLAVAAVLIPQFDLGSILNRILGKKPKRGSVLDAQGRVVGRQVKIVENHNPFRDMTKVKLEDGTEVALPEGVKDTDVQEVKVETTNAVSIVPRHDRLTAIFDRTRRSNG